MCAAHGVLVDQLRRRLWKVPHTPLLQSCIKSAAWPLPCLHLHAVLLPTASPRQLFCDVVSRKPRSLAIAVGHTVHRCNFATLSSWGSALSTA